MEYDARAKALRDLTIAIEEIVLRLSVRQYGLEGTRTIFKLLDSLQSEVEPQKMSEEEQIYLRVLLTKNALEGLLEPFFPILNVR